MTSHTDINDSHQKSDTVTDIAKDVAETPEVIVPQTLDTMTFPLIGARLIEASAGTGKTFTIAGLYLRLLLGHGTADTRHPVALTVDQILVVTFTEAATAELRDRIRARIHDARLAFARGVSSDPVISPLLTEVTDHRHATTLLLQAEQQMDEAAIYTIHGFCQRMLTQNAFESGSRFNNEFITDESLLARQAVADFWRQSFHHLPKQAAMAAYRVWKKPEDLYQHIKGYLSGAGIKMQPATGVGDFHHYIDHHITRIEAVKQQWREVTDDFVKVIADSDIKKNPYNKNNVPNWLSQIEQWASSSTNDLSFPENLYRFSSSELTARTTKGNPPEHTVFNAIDDFLTDPPQLDICGTVSAIEACRQRLAAAKKQQQLLSFDDLLAQLSVALDSDSSDILAERIRSLYPVAMIDEFQDTDPLQYLIFNQLYLQYPDCGWFMIGDPKQAIYAFRGADIFTYIKARKQVTSHFTLGTNWRSSADMVAAANQIFTRSERPFIYDSDIPFIPVSASDGADQKSWQINNRQQAAMRYWFANENDDTLSTDDYDAQMATATATEINQILTAADCGNGYFVHKNNKRVIQAGNIAVLVRTGSQAKLIKKALTKQGIASVYLSNRESVFNTPLATELTRILTALLAPEDSRLLRSAMATSLFALDVQALERLNNDESTWDDTVSEFKDYQRLWKRKGVLPMLRQLMHRRAIPQRLLQQDNGDGQLTNLMHLGELLQQASLDIDSPHGLLRWFGDTIQQTIQYGTGSDDQIQRLESERNLVQIITIHKSKGLEYDLVFIPFAMRFKAANTAQYHDETAQQTLLDLSKEKDNVAKAEKERLAEDLRLLYVAVTRAVYGCYIGVAGIKIKKSPRCQSHKSAMGYILQGIEKSTVNGLREAVNDFAEELDCVEVHPFQPEDIAPYTEVAKDPITYSASVLKNSIDRDWRMTSYSGIIRQDSSHQHHDAASNSPIDILRLDLDSADDINHSNSDDSDDTQMDIFTFPRGARPGTFLHTLFETVEFTQPATSAENTKVIKDLMDKEQYAEEWLPVLQSMMDTVLSTPLDGQSLILKHTQAHQKLVEMPFLLPIKVLNAPQMNQVVMRHDPLSAQAGELGFDTVRGMLKGFIDLIFEYQGKYYVLDWKSNHLGDAVSCYHGDALKAAMADHRYDLQYQIYALALHRFLSTRIANYDYQQHFGGVYYLFLRGMDGQSEHGIFHSKPSQAFLNELDQLIDGKLTSPSHPHEENQDA